MHRFRTLFFASLLAAPLAAQDVHVQVSPQFPVSPDPTDKFPTIQMAMDHAVAPGPHGRLYVHILPGTYKERVWISPERTRTTLLGMGTDPSQVTIVAGQSAKSSGGTFFSETVQILATDFQADNITFQNDAGPVGQAVAVAANADRAIFKHCRLLGDQDTLFANHGRQLYIESYIRGGTDFIFGNATAVFERSELHEIRNGYLTAQSRTSDTQTTGYVIDHSRVTTEPGATQQFYLGRPWRAYSRVVYLDTEMPALLAPEGWHSWSTAPRNIQTTYYAEYRSTGAGAATTARVGWSHQLTEKEAARFAPAAFLAGDDHWDALAEAAKLP